MKKTKSIRYFILCLMCVYVLSGCKSEPEPFDIDEVSVPVNIIEVSPDENSGDTSMTSEDSESKDIYSKIGYSWSLDDAQALVRSGKIDFTLEKAWAVDNIEKIPGTAQSFYADGSFFIYSENGDIIKDVRYPDFIMEDGSFIGGGQIILLEIFIHNQDAISEVAVVDEYTSPYLFRADSIIRVQHDGSELYPYYFEQAGKYADHPMLFQVNPGEDETICVGFYVSGNIDGTCRDLSGYKAKIFLNDRKMVLIDLNLE